MRNCSRRNGSRFGLRLAIATAAAALLTGCADATRFDDPLANPFKSAANGGSRGARRVDRTPTASIPVREASAKTIKSDAALAPTASVANWSAEGGTPVTVGQGETAAVLGTRYGVPPEALLRTNNLSSGQLSPGSKIIIPVYRPGSGRLSAASPKPANDSAKGDTVPKKSVSKKVVAKSDEPKSEIKRETDKAKPKAKPEVKTLAKSLEKTELEKHKATAAKEQKIKEAKLKKEKEHIAQLAKKKELAKNEKADKVKLAEAESEKKQPIASIAKTDLPKAESKHEVDPTPTASLPTDASPEFRWPARGRVIQSFKAGSNNGINISVPEGTPVKAAENGVVAYAGGELKNYGNLVLVRHENGYVSAYAHNASIEVKKGDQVRRGQVIARAGQTGSVTSPQVHFELRKGSKPVDPSELLASN